MAVAYTKIAGALPSLEGVINAGTDQWAFALTNAIPGSSTFVAGTTDLATGGGYTQGGANVSTTSANEVAGTFKLILASPATWTASAGGFTFRYILLVNKTNNITPGYWDYGSSVVMNGTNGDTFAFTPDAANGVFQVT
jgi:hypothetical protein